MIRPGFLSRQNSGNSHSVFSLCIERKRLFLLSAYLLSILTISIVYFLGGTITVYTNLIYIPIALAAVTNGKVHGVIHAGASGLMMASFVPVEIHSTFAVPQNTLSGIIRISIYAVIAFIIGYFSEKSQKEYVQNVRSQQELNREQLAMIFALVKLSESRDNYLDMHIERVGYLCRFLAIQLQTLPQYSDSINEEYIENIFKASQLHDIGKVGIPDRILLKPGKLTTEEFSIMKKHAEIGANTLREVQKKYPANRFLKMGIDIAQCHHEKWDGTGYPRGLSGEDIPLSARIMSLVDVYDSLRTRRIYKPAYSHNESIEILQQNKGTHFDPLICEVLLENQDDFLDVYEQLISHEAMIP